MAHRLNPISPGVPNSFVLLELGGVKYYLTQGDYESPSGSHSGYVGSFHSVF